MSNRQELLDHVKSLPKQWQKDPFLAFPIATALERCSEQQRVSKILEAGIKFIRDRGISSAKDSHHQALPAALCGDHGSIGPDQLDTRMSKK